MQTSINRLARGLLLFGAGLFLILPTTLRAQGAGSITGRVSNAATSAYLEGARIEIEGTGRVTFTDREGRYQLNNVPEGGAVLVVSYTGLDTQRFTVNVQTGGLIRQDVGLTSEIYALEEFTVAGLREGEALAITLQRQAPNVKNVVASDTFGNVPDGNIGDFLQRLPGITAVYVGSDVRQVQIRGIDPDLNSVTMDGNRVASSQSAGLGRAFEFEQASLGLIETIEVAKAPTPDMDADSIGGSVNLVSKSAFDRANPNFISYTVGGVYRPKYQRKRTDPLVGPSMNISLSRVFGERQNWGLFLTSTWHVQPGGDAAGIYNYRNSVDDAWMHQVNVPRPAGAMRERWATGGKIEYKLNENTDFSLNTQYNFFRESGDTRVFQQQTSQTVAVINPTTGAITGGPIMPGYSIFRTEARVHNNTLSQLTTTTVDKSGRTYQLQPTVRHRFPDMEIDYSANWSSSATYYDYGPNDRKLKSNPKMQVTAQLRNIGWIAERETDMNWARVTQTAGPDMYDLNNYSNMVANDVYRRGYDTIFGGKVNLKKNLDLAMPVQLKTGLTYRNQNRETWRNSKRYNYLGPDGIQGSADDELGQFLETSNQHDGANRGLRRPPYISGWAVARHIFEFPELWGEDRAFNALERLRWRREITEEVAAGYVMGTMQWNNVSVLGGLRMEQTRTDGEGPVQDLTPEEQARRAAWVGPVTPAEAVRRVEAEWTGRLSSKGSYRNTFPGLHLKYEPIRGMVGRLSYSAGIGRPGFDSIIPNTVVNYDAETVRINNVGLRPQFSDNFDLSVEYYFEPVGLVSVGLFRKEIDGFIFQSTGELIGSGPNNGFEGQYEGFRIITQANGGSATVNGLEFNYQQRLSFLPGGWKGLSVYANYTYLETKGDYGGQTQQTTSQIAGFLPKAGNVGISYAAHGWDLRLQGIWRGHHLRQYSVNAAQVSWEKERFTVNWKSKYSFSEKLAVYFDVENVFSEPLTNSYWYEPRRVREYRLIAPKVLAGIQGRF